MSGDVRSPVNNPFEPGSDRIPTVWAGRVPQLADWRDRLRPRRARGQYERGRMYLGEPGIGKSVLARRIARDAEQRGDLATRQIRIPRGGDPIALLSEALVELAGRAGLPTAREQRLGELLGRVRALSLAGASVSLAPGDGPPAHRDLTALLVEVARQAFAEQRVVVVHLDEVQNVTSVELLSATLVALGDALAHEEPHHVPGGAVLTVHLPIVVLLTGLPEFYDDASSLSGATFTRRFAAEVLEPISDSDLRDALHPFVFDGCEVETPAGARARVLLDPDAAEAIVERACGDPFVFQLAGQAAWDAGDGARITRREVELGWRFASREARDHVERQLSRLPGKERALLDAMAGLEESERNATRIAQRMGHDSATQIGPTAQRLDRVRGLIDRGRRYAFRSRTVGAYLEGRWP